MKKSALLLCLHIVILNFLKVIKSQDLHALLILCDYLINVSVPTYSLQYTWSYYLSFSCLFRIYFLLCSILYCGKSLLRELVHLVCLLHFSFSMNFFVFSGSDIWHHPPSPAIFNDSFQRVWNAGGPTLGCGRITWAACWKGGSLDPHFERILLIRRGKGWGVCFFPQYFRPFWCKLLRLTH